MRNCNRQGFSLIELLVVIAIIAVLMSLLMAGVQKVRRSAGIVQCSNNLRQMVLAVHNYADASGGSLPGQDTYDAGSGNRSTLHWFLLPYLDQENLFQSQNGVYMPSLGGPAIKTYLCPLDFTTRDGLSPVEQLGGGGVGGPQTTYPSNVGLFGPINGPPDPNGGPPPGNWNAPMRNTFVARYPIASIPDGMSSTIAFTERTSYFCNGDSSVTVRMSQGIQFSAGFNWETEMGPLLQYPFPAWTYASSYGSGPNPILDIPGPQSMVSTGSYTQLVAIHRASVNCGFMDGSVRKVSSKVPNPIWGALVTPDDGQAVSDETY